MKILYLVAITISFCFFVEVNAQKVVFSTKLQTILIANDTIENFEPGKITFTVNLPYTTLKTPLVQALTTDSQTEVNVLPAENLYGTVKQRTTNIILKQKNNSYVDTFQVIFKILPKLDLYILIGQSNMAGRGKITPEYADTLKNAYLLTSNGNMEVACNPLNKYSNIRKELKLQQVGPGYGFSKTMVEKTGANIGLIVNARGGSSINSWIKGAKDGYYEKTMDRLKDVSKWGELKAILWHQGETDSKNTDIYQQKLTDFVQNLRTDLNSTQLLFVAGELAYWRGDGEGSTAFNNMIRNISVFIPNSTYVSAEGLSPLIDVTDPHFDAKSQMILGERYALKIMDMKK